MEKKIIFVDCFNTIICRNVSPKEVLFNWAEKLGNKYSIEPAVIFKLYKKYETKTCIKNKLKTGESEYKFADILMMVATHLKEHFNINNFDVNSFVVDALDFYVLAEQESHYLNTEVVNYLKQAKSQGKQIFVVSDFYCEKHILARWFANLNVLELIDDIFVSCEFGLSKRTGKLYKYLIKTYNFNRKSIMMIGDNAHSDCRMARLRGITAKHINSKNKKSSKELKQKIKYGASFCEFKKIFNMYGTEYNYSNYAFVFYLYYKRLHEALQKNGAKDVMFMSREGQFMKKLFDEYCVANNYKINTHYFYVSRNSVLVASLKPLEQETFDIMLRSINKMNIRSFLATLNFSKVEIEQIKNDIAVDIDKASKDFIASKEFCELKSSKLFVELYESKRSEQRANLDTYLKSFNIDFQAEGMHLVDVGWFGTIQDFLAKYFDGKVETVGYYVGTLDKRKISHSKKIGLIFSATDKTVYGNKILRHRRMDYEQLYRADHNRVSGYKVVDGKPEIVFGTELNENKVFNELIKPLQEQIFDKFSKICRLDYKWCSTIEPITLKMFYVMICNQSKEDFEWLKKAENCTYDSFARIGKVFTKFKDGIRMFAYKGLDLLFKTSFAIKINALKYVKLSDLKKSKKNK